MKLTVISLYSISITSLEFRFLKVRTTVENVLYEYTGEKSAATYTIHLHPCVVFRNLLPTTVSYTLEVNRYFRDL